MRYVTGKITNPKDAVYKVKWPVIENHALLYVWRSDGAKLRVMRHGRTWSLVPDPFFATPVPKNILVPVLSEIEEKVETKIYETAKTQTVFITAIYAHKNEIKDYKPDLIRAYTDAPEQVNIDNPTWVEIYKNKTDKPENIWGVSVVGAGIGYFSIYVEDEKIINFDYLSYDALCEASNAGIIVLNRSLSPGGEVKIYFYKPQVGGGATATGYVWITKEPLWIAELPYLKPNPEQTISQTPPEPTDTGTFTPTPPAPPPAAPNHIPPYPIPPEEQGEITTEPPVTAPAGTTTAYQTGSSLQPTTINRPNEQPVVEPLPSPYGMVRPTADAFGRKRKTTAAITYKAGKLDVTDANAHTIFQGYHTTRVSLYAKAENWEIKILPIYDWLKGKSITDMDTIYLEQGERRDIDIEAREIQATCPTGSSTVTGTLYYEIYL